MQVLNQSDLPGTPDWIPPAPQSQAELFVSLGASGAAVRDTGEAEIGGGSSCSGCVADSVTSPTLFGNQEFGARQKKRNSR